MSLAVVDDRLGGRSESRSRSRSRSGDGRPRHEPAREAAPPHANVREPSYGYPEDDLDDWHGSGRRQDPMHGGSGLPYPSEGPMDSMLAGGQPLYSHDGSRPLYRTASPERESSHRSSRTKMDGQLPGSFPEHHGPRRDDQPRDSRRDGWDGPDKNKQGGRLVSDTTFSFLPQKYRQQYADSSHDKSCRRDRDSQSDRRSKKERDEEDLAYGQPPPPRSPRPAPPATHGGYISGTRSAEQPSSKHGRGDADDRRGSTPLDDSYGSWRSYRDDGQGAGANTNTLTVEPTRRQRDQSRDRRRDKSPGPSALAVEAAPRDRSRDRSRDGRASTRDKSPQPPTARMSTLTVDTGRSSNLSLAAAPASPLLESYRGTYQDCSPMPSPLLLASQSPGTGVKAVDALSPLNSDVEGETKKIARRARFHDTEDMAARLARALKGDRPPDTQPLVEMLPSLTHEQVMELRDEYKQLVRTGSGRKGVNVAKHIRARLKDDDANLMKACYAVALGKWESEAYWANFWYQGDKTRRELLMESLMGRTNQEIRQIKDAFTDKKYNDSLTRCMKTELKEDKFKKAVLMVLEERRMEDYDGQGRRLPLDGDLVDRDVEDLRKAVKSDKGGESAMIAIVVKRSDGHLRAVLQEYEHDYRANFAREALKKSGNLVGELLAHVLNGVINRPVRDALLVHHALTASRRDGLRRELLISRLVRLHWSAAHMQAVARAYRERYGAPLQDAVRDATAGQWGRFCCELCIARTPDEVRRVERVQRAA